MTTAKAPPVRTRRVMAGAPVKEDLGTPTSLLPREGEFTFIHRGDAENEDDFDGRTSMVGVCLVVFLALSFICAALAWAAESYAPAVVDYLVDLPGRFLSFFINHH